jgi:chitin synthase
VISRPGSKGTDLIAPIPRLPVSISNNTSVDSRSDAGHSSTPSVDDEITPVPQPAAERDAVPQFKSEGAEQAKPKVETVAEDDVGNAVLLKRGKRKVTTQKYVLTAGLIAVK